jgi:hypothetical protein
LDSKPHYLDLLVFLPGGFTPLNLTHRFCHECLAITKHSGTDAPRSSCEQCGADYSSKAPTSPHGAALWASAQAEIQEMKKRAPRTLTGRIIPAGGINALLGITEPIVIPNQLPA